MLEDEPTVRRIISEEPDTQGTDNYEDDDEYEDNSDNNSVEEVPDSLYIDLVTYVKDLGIPIAEYLTADTIQEFVETFLPE
jgi:hypothetical protein